MSRDRTFGSPLPIALRAIGVMRSPHVVHHDAPRQPRSKVPGRVEVPARAVSALADGEIHVAGGLQNCLHDLAGFSHVWVLFLCHHLRGWNSKVMPPRDTQKRGVFATRSPTRPNPIGLSCLRLLRIERRVLHVGAHDILDGSPILDLKPYLPYCDSVPDADIGYVRDLPVEASDHRDWWTQKGIVPPRVYGRRAPAPDRDQDR